MYKGEYEECCRITSIDNNEDVILFDVGVNIMDLPISKFEVSLIKPIDNNVVLNGFMLEKWTCRQIKILSKKESL